MTDEQEPGRAGRADDGLARDRDGLVVEPDHEIDLSDMDDADADAPVADDPVADEALDDDPVADEPVADDAVEDDEALDDDPVADEPVEDVEVPADDPDADEPVDGEEDVAWDEAPAAGAAGTEVDEPDDVDAGLDADDEESAEAEEVAAAEEDADEWDGAHEPPAGAVDADPEEREDELDEDPGRHDDETVAVAAGAWDRDPDDHGDAPPASTAAADDERPRRRRGRWVLLALLLLVGVAYVAGWWLTGTRLPANATVGGVDVGGMSPAAARGAVEQELRPREGQPVELVHEKKTFEVDPADAGLALDVDRSVEQAGGRRSWDPRDMVALFVGEHDHAPALDVDDAKLDSTIGTISEAVDVPVVEAQITFPKAKPKGREPEPGLVVRKADAARTIQDAYLVEDEPVDVPTATVEPVVDEEGLERAIEEIGKPAVSGPVTIEVGDQEVELPVTAYAPALVVRVVDGAMTPQIDPEELAGPLTDSTTGIGKKAVDATVEIRGGRPVVVPGKEGVGLQPKEMSEKLVPVLTKSGDERVVQVEAKVVQPERTTAEAKKLGIKEKVSEFSTSFPYAEYRNTNQTRAAELIDGVIVEPGETFSFNDTVGERTEANGFVVGTIIDGGVFREELGGGVSQVVTTTYNAAFFAGMDDVEHHPHAFYIDRYPVGREATVAWGSLDLKFRNSTKHGVLIKASVRRSTPGTPGRTTVELWSTKVWDVEAGKSARRNLRQPGTQYDDTNRCVEQAPVQGFDIDIYRTFKQGGAVVKRETVTARYQAADRVICGKRPKGD